MALLALFIAYPWLAVVVAAIFAWLYGRSGRASAASAAVIWLLYGVYEYSMHRRWLCSGECNIRVDLLLIYPLLIILSFVAAWSALRSTPRQRRARG